MLKACVQRNFCSDTAERERPLGSGPEVSFRVQDRWQAKIIRELLRLAAPATTGAAFVLVPPATISDLVMSTKERVKESPLIPARLESSHCQGHRL
jgi:hypothetical protein